MTHSNNNDNCSNINDQGVSKVDFFKQIRKEMNIEDEEDIEGAPRSIGVEAAILRKDGKIEVISYTHDETAFSDGSCIYEPGTPGFDAVLEEHGPLVPGKPHGIKIYPAPTGKLPQK
jgi:hypothetical protein